VFDSREAGRRRGRIFQRFWDHVEVERAGGSGGRWTQGIELTSMYYDITPHFAEVEIIVLVHLVSQPILHTEFKDIIQDLEAW